MAQLSNFDISLGLCIPPGVFIPISCWMCYIFDCLRVAYSEFRPCSFKYASNKVIFGAGICGTIGGFKCE